MLRRLGIVATQQIMRVAPQAATLEAYLVADAPAPGAGWP
jgi:hypothetical protein